MASSSYHKSGDSAGIQITSIKQKKLNWLKPWEYILGQREN